MTKKRRARGGRRRRQPAPVPLAHQRTQVALAASCPARPRCSPCWRGSFLAAALSATAVATGGCGSGVVALDAPRPHNGGRRRGPFGSSSAAAGGLLPPTRSPGAVSIDSCVASAFAVGVLIASAGLLLLVLPHSLAGDAEIVNSATDRRPLRHRRHHAAAAAGRRQESDTSSRRGAGVRPRRQRRPQRSARGVPARLLLLRRPRRVEWRCGGAAAAEYPDVVPSVPPPRLPRLECEETCPPPPPSGPPPPLPGAACWWLLCTRFGWLSPPYSSSSASSAPMPSVRTISSRVLLE